MTPFVSKMASQTNSLSGSIKGSMTNLMPQFPTTGPITKVTSSDSESSFSTNHLIDLDDLEQFDFLTDNPDQTANLPAAGRKLTDSRQVDRRLTDTNPDSENSNPNNRSNLAEHTYSIRPDVANSKNFSTPESRRQRKSRTLRLSASRPELSRTDGLATGRSSSMSNLSGGSRPPPPPVSSARKPSSFANSTRTSALKQKAKYQSKSMIADSLPSPARYRANRL